MAGVQVWVKRALFALVCSVTYGLFLSMEVAALVAAVLVLEPDWVPGNSVVRCLTLAQWAFVSVTSCIAWAVYYCSLRHVRRSAIRGGWIGSPSSACRMRLWRCTDGASCISNVAFVASIGLVVVMTVAGLASYLPTTRPLFQPIVLLGIFLFGVLTCISAATLLVLFETEWWARVYHYPTRDTHQGEGHPDGALDEYNMLPEDDSIELGTNELPVRGAQ